MLKNINMRVTILLFVMVAMLALELTAVFSGAALLRRLELGTRDLFMRLHASQASDEIVIIAIDDFSFNWTGYQWPWPRAYFARVVEELNRGGARVVGLDILLFELDSDPIGDNALARALEESQSSVVVMQIFRENNSETLMLPVQPITRAVDRMGITPVLRDEDAITRSILVYEFSNYNNTFYYNWAFQVASLYLGVPEPAGPTPGSISFNQRDIPLTGGGQMLINYNGPAGTYTTYSIASVAEGDVLQQNPDAFRGKIVLVGATSPTLQDLYPTPYDSRSPTPGVEVVANAIDTILSGRYLQISPPWVSLAMILVMAGASWLILRSQTIGRSLLALFGGMLAYLVASFFTFSQFNLFLPVISPLLMLLAGVVLPQVERAFAEEVEKRRIRTLFTRFISPDMVNQLLETSDIDSLNRRSNITVLFSDIRGFTTLAEKMTPEEVVGLLNPYLDAMTQIIHQHGGTVDKYEGDAIMAFYGEPVRYQDHARRAAETALDMAKELKALRQRWEEEGRYTEKFSIGIGLNSGEAFVGLLGSAQRVNYTAIGDNVNLAARLQDLTKTYRWPVLLSESTYLQIKEYFDAEFIESVLVKGKTEPVNVYRLLGRKGAIPEEQLQPLNI